MQVRVICFFFVNNIIDENSIQHTSYLHLILHSSKKTGGGGFLALISTSDHMNLRDSIHKFSNQYFACEKEQNVFSIHSCTICDEGLTVREYADIEECGADYFKLDWHS